MRGRNAFRLTSLSAVVVLVASAIAPWTAGSTARAKPTAAHASYGVDIRSSGPPRTADRGLMGAEAAEGYEAAEKAECGSSDRPETDLQGRVPPAERYAGFNGFSCNLKLIGKYTGEGAGIQLASYGHCAYYNTAQDGKDGVIVIDAANPETPVATDFLETAATAEPWESTKVHHGRGLLAMVEYNADGFSIFDVKTDCAHPTLLADVHIPDGEGHAGNFSQDGMTYYGSQFNGVIWAIDVTDPAHPSSILNFSSPSGVHDTSTSVDGNRLYIANSERIVGVRSATDGLIVMDVSDIQARADDPQVSEIGRLDWDDGAIAQMTQRVLIDGHPYMIVTDENGSGGLQGGWEQACASGLPPFGMARIIDMADETKPSMVSRVALEVGDPANCPLVLADVPAAAIFSYDSHYCSVDDPADAKIMACGWYESGVRVFDIGDPLHPKEVAYYNPPSRIGRQPSGASYIGTGAVQWELSMPQLRLADCQLWITTTHSGFQVLKFTNGAVNGCTI